MFQTQTLSLFYFKLLCFERRCFPIETSKRYIPCTPYCKMHSTKLKIQLTQDSQKRFSAHMAGMHGVHSVFNSTNICSSLFQSLIGGYSCGYTSTSIYIRDLCLYGLFSNFYLVKSDSCNKDQFLGRFIIYLRGFDEGCRGYP